MLRASFRPRLAATPLRFAIPSSLSDWEEDFHLQAVEHARHTEWIGRLLRPLVRRRVFACADPGALPVLAGWPGLTTVLAVENIRGINGTGKVTAVIR